MYISSCIFERFSRFTVFLLLQMTAISGDLLATAAALQAGGAPPGDRSFSDAVQTQSLLLDAAYRRLTDR
jgi:hypothetical protein